MEDDLAQLTSDTTNDPQNTTQYDKDQSMKRKRVENYLAQLMSDRMDGPQDTTQDDKDNSMKEIRVKENKTKKNYKGKSNKPLGRITNVIEPPEILDKNQGQAGHDVNLKTKKKVDKNPHKN